MISRLLTVQAMAKLYHSVCSLHYHLVLVTKYRRRCLNARMHDELRAQISHLLADYGCDLLEMNGEPDHVHLLIEATPKITLCRLVNTIKTATSRRLRRRFATHLSRYYWKPVFWSRSYCLVSCGGAPLSVIKQYINGQAGFD